MSEDKESQKERLDDKSKHEKASLKDMGDLKKQKTVKKDDGKGSSREKSKDSKD